MGNGESIQMISKLCSDKYGDLYKAKWRGRLVVARRLHLVFVHTETANGFNSLHSELLEELKSLRALRHENILETIHMFHRNGEDPTLLTELYGSSLSEMIAGSNSNTAISIKDVNTIMLGVASGLEYLHNRAVPVVHGDLTTKNILLNSKKQVKLANVGFARMIAAEMKVPDKQFARGTSKTPEFTPERDIYGFGVSMMETMVCNPLQNFANLLHPNSGSTSVRQQIVLQEMEEDHPLRGLVLSCLEEHSQRRPTATDIVNQLHSPKMKTVITRFALKQSVTKVEKEFLEWIPIRSHTIEKLKELQLPQMASQLDKHHRNINIATATAASTSLIATGMFVGGFIASFFTAGAALPIAITGGVMGAAGGLTTLGSKMVDIVLSKIANKTIMDVLEDDKAKSASLRDQLDLLDCVILENVQNALQNINIADEDEEKEYKKEEIMKIVNNVIIDFSVPDGGKQLYPGGTRGLSAVLGVAASGTTAGVEVARASAVAFDALTTTAQVTHVAGFVLSIISLPFDIYFLAKSSKELKDQSPSQVAEVLRSIPARMICPDKKQVPEIIRDYVSDQVSRALQDIMEENDSCDVSFVNAELHLDDGVFD